MPERRLAALAHLAVSAAAHGAGAALLMLVVGQSMTSGRDRPQIPWLGDQDCVDASHVVFLAPRAPASGGGGGGNRIDGPIRRAEAPGPDAITRRAAARSSITIVAASPSDDAPLVPALAIDAVPLASGVFEQTGLPSMSVPAAPSTGPGSGGGAGAGTGTGIGSGQGPGVGPGSGGGTGGGVYRPGGSVTAPRVIAEVKPKYTNSALRRRLQGTVELELVVTRDGRAAQVRVVRSIDPGGLDEEAIAAVLQWRFEPGRYAGTPVDVSVVVLLDFWIH